MYELLESGSDAGSHRCASLLIALIVASVAAAIFESVESIAYSYHDLFENLELFFVACFTVEYALRIWSCVESDDPDLRHPIYGRLRYVRTPMAVIDLLAILPFYAAAIVPIDLRFLRVLRILRILKLSHYFSALSILLEIVRVERRSFGAAFFMLSVGTLFASSGIYLFEREAQPEAFGSIPDATWWAIATLTTVGYGDVVPVTIGGKVFGASMAMIGVAMVAIPAGILASGFSSELARRQETYAVQFDLAAADGVIDDTERAVLERLRAELGLGEESFAPRGRSGPQRHDPPAIEKCPHCGESVEIDAR